MFHDHLVRKKAFLYYKNICFTQLQYDQYCIFPKRVNPWFLVQNWKLRLGLVLDKLGLEIMFDIHQGRKQTLPDNKKQILQNSPY